MAQIKKDLGGNSYFFKVGSLKFEINQSKDGEPIWVNIKDDLDGTDYEDPDALPAFAFQVTVKEIKALANHFVMVRDLFE